MDDAHSALLIIICVIVLFINFSIHSFNSAINELNSSDIDEDKNGERLKFHIENIGKVLYCMYIINVLSGIFFGWFFVRSFSSGIKSILSNITLVGINSFFYIYCIVIVLYILCCVRDINT